jgi:hypothetical protein
MAKSFPLALQVQMPEFTTPQEFEAQRLGQERAKYANELQRMRFEEERKRPEVMNRLSQMMAKPGAIERPEEFFGMGEQGKSAYESLQQAQQFKEQQETKKKAVVGSALASAILDPSDSGMQSAYSKLKEAGVPSEPYEQIFSAIPEDQRRSKLLSYAVSSPEGMKLLNFASPKFEERSSATEKWFEDVNPYSPTFGKKQSNVEAMPSMAHIANLMNAYTNARIPIPQELLDKFGGVGVAVPQGQLPLPKLPKEKLPLEMKPTPAAKPMTAKQELDLKKIKAADMAITNGAVNVAEDVTSLVDELVGNKEKKIPPHPGLGRMTGIASIIPSGPTQARAAEQRLETLKGKVAAFGRQLASQESKLGNMAVQEWKIVASSIQAIDPMAPNFEQQMRDIERQVQRFSGSVKKRYQMTYEPAPSERAKSSAAPESAEKRPSLNDIFGGK